MNRDRKAIIKVLLWFSAFTFTVIYGAISTQNDIDHVKDRVNSELTAIGEKNMSFVSERKTGNATVLHLYVNGLTRHDKNYEDKRIEYKRRALNYVCTNDSYKNKLQSGENIQVDLLLGRNISDSFANLNITSSKCHKLGT